MVALSVHFMGWHLFLCVISLAQQRAWPWGEDHCEVSGRDRMASLAQCSVLRGVGHSLRCHPRNRMAILEMERIDSRASRFQASWFTPNKGSAMTHFSTFAGPHR